MAADGYGGQKRSCAPYRPKYLTALPDLSKLNPIFDALGYWARLSIYDWYVWSHLANNQLYEALRVHLHTDDTIVIVVIQSQPAMGWAPQWFWDFINSGGVPKPLPTP